MRQMSCFDDGRPKAPGGTRRLLSADNAPLNFPNQSHDSFLLSSVPADAFDFALANHYFIHKQDGGCGGVTVSFFSEH